MNKTAFRTAFISALIFLTHFSQNLHSQNINIDSLQSGRKYKIVLFDNREIIGTLKSSDSIYVNISDKDGIYRLRKDDIFYISKSLYPSKYNVIISVGGGLSFLTGDYNYNYYYSGQRSTGGYNLSLSADFPISDTKTIGFEAGYHNFKRGAYTDYNTTYDAAFMSFYTFKIDFKIGNFETKNKFFYYAVFGIGMNHTKYSESNSVYYNYSDSTYSTQYMPSYSSTSAVLGLGGGFGYKFNRHFGIYTEIQYNLITSSPFLFWGSGYFPVKAGLVYMIY